MTDKGVRPVSRRDPIDPTIASTVEGIIDRLQPELRIHGYTHVPCDFAIFDIQVVCDPWVYPSESSAKGF